MMNIDDARRMLLAFAARLDGEPTGYDEHHMREAARVVLLALADLRREPPPPPTWEPIATAPTTKLIQVIDMTAAAPVPMTATQKQKGVWSTLPGYYNIHPTHWQPLPSPPGADAKEQP